MEGFLKTSARAPKRVLQHHQGIHEGVCVIGGEYRRRPVVRGQLPFRSHFTVTSARCEIHIRPKEGVQAVFVPELRHRHAYFC